MINRKANLYRDYKKEGSPIEIVTVLLIGVVADENGSMIAASVEKENGDVIEVDHDALKFIED